MQMNQQELRNLLEFLSGSDIQELKLEGDDFRLEVRRNLPGPAPVLL
ncbi:MAG: acetyl-CoA carboxylase, biotin carboxyl carrier protein, partial [Synechococcaceae bacterium WB6_3B_236]|nr:acetyl-CoA carboxylase, biotin carboxyl carrier protein [Synechococcaceae bacterium WB6_3B_236]